MVIKSVIAASQSDVVMVEYFSDGPIMRSLSHIKSDAILVPWLRVLAVIRN